MALAFCPICNRKFKSYLNRGKQTKYCSLMCYWRNMVGKSHGHKTMNGKVAWNKGKTTKIDSRIISGKKHGNWKGDKYTENYRERRRFQKLIQNKVFIRDNYTCQICGTRGGILHVDHIQSFAHYIEGRFDMKNLRTLCVKCHYFITFHKIMPKNSHWGFSFLKEVD